MTPPFVPKSGQPRTVGARFSLSQIIAGLFTRPAMLMPLAYESWNRALKIVLLAILLCGGLMGTVRSLAMFKVAENWAAWFEERVGTVSIADSKLSWARPENLPATRWNNSWRVDFMPENSDFSEINPAQEGRRGVWLSPDAIYLWGRDREQQIVGQPLWRDGRLFDQVEAATIIGDELVIAPGEFGSRFRAWVWYPILPLMISFELLRVGFFFFFYTLIFTVVPFVMRSPMSGHGFARVHAFYLYAGIPPLLIATVYSLLALPWLDFNLLFIVAFLVYMGFVAWRTGRAMQSFAQSQ